MKTSTIRIPILFCLLFIGGLGDLFAQTFGITSGGAPTITGSLGGSVSGTSSVTGTLSVNINLGEVSPANHNSIVKVIIPIAVRSTAAYKVTASITGTASTNVQGLQASDVGFGLNNMRAMGSRSQVCTRSGHTIYSPFNNDPASSASISSSGRVDYLSSLADIATTTTILSGPTLSQGTGAPATDNGYIFNAIFVITPQFYAVSSGNATITFVISSGPTAPC
jgi:hypothetical protein